MVNFGKIFAYNDWNWTSEKNQRGGLKISMIQNEQKQKNLIKRGDIWFADLPDMGDSIQYGLRPVLIVSNDMCNKHSSVITVIPLTSVTKKKKQPTHIYIEHSELKNSMVICEQIITISKKRIIHKICEIEKDDMNRIEKGIKVQIGI